MNNPFSVIDLGQIYAQADAARNNHLAARLQQLQLDRAMKDDADQNAMAQIFRNNYTPAKTEPVMYQPQGPTPDGSALPPVPTGETKTTPGKMDMSGAMNELYSRFPDQAMKFQHMLAQANGQTPSAVNEWNFLKQQFPDMPVNLDNYLNMKRGNYDIKEVNGVPTLVGKSPTAGVTPLTTLQNESAGKSAISQATAQGGAFGTDTGHEAATAADMKANMPRLEEVVKQLSALGKNATYTMTGRAFDIARSELGMSPREAAIARKEYISKVDNEILPLLRMTFGAQFTEREGATLRNTLGDPNVTPAEKDAVLRSFIDSKRAQIETKSRRLGDTEQKAPAAPKQNTAPQSAIDYLKSNNNKIVRDQFMNKYGYLPEGF